MNEQPFYCEYRVEYPAGTRVYLDSGSIKTKTLRQMRREIKACVKLAKERGAEAIHFHGIAETYVKRHACPNKVQFA